MIKNPKKSNFPIFPISKTRRHHKKKIIADIFRLKIGPLVSIWEPNRIETEKNERNPKPTTYNPTG